MRAVVGELPWQTNTGRHCHRQLLMLTKSRRGSCPSTASTARILPMLGPVSSSGHGARPTGAGHRCVELLQVPGRMVLRVGQMDTWSQWFCFIEVYVQRGMEFVAQFGVWHWKMRPRLLALLGKNFFTLFGCTFSSKSLSFYFAFVLCFSKSKEQ